MVKKIAVAPQIGDYQIITDIIINRLLGYKTMKCPPMTKKTMEIGSRHSPDMICTPFKIILGSFIECAEKGANVFIMPGVGCRLGFYDILHKQILEDLGYECEMIPLFDYIPTLKRMFTALNIVNPELTQDEFNTVIEMVIKIVFDMDELANKKRLNIAFEINEGEHEKIYKAYLKEVKDSETLEDAATIGNNYKEKMNNVKINKPEKPIRIGIVGEIYVIAEPFSNCYLEKWLAENNIEIVHSGDLSTMAHAIFNLNEQIEQSGGYVDYNIGATANEAIAHAHQMIKDGIDGIIHVKPASCSPEITAMTILQNMSNDYDVPFLYITFDTETSEAGIHTRLEAFTDMLKQKFAKQTFNRQS